MSDQEATLFVIAAPSGAGKTSLVRALTAADHHLAVSTSHTTRGIRPGEVNDKDYHFVDVANFEKLVAEGAFLEHAEVFGHFYATSQAAVMAELEQGNDVILEIDWQGAAQIKQQFTNSCSIFIFPPSIAALEARLRQRGQDSEAVITRRLANAKTEMSHYQDFDYRVVNDDFDRTLVELQAIIQAKRAGLSYTCADHADLIAELLA